MTSGIQPFDWRTLITPFRPIFGSPRNDTLRALAEGDVVFGLGGNDRLSSAFNRTALLGGRGYDTLTTNVTPEPRLEPLHLLAVQSGDSGNDTLRANLSIMQSELEQSGNVTAELFQNGGDGHDVITARANMAVGAIVTINIQIFGGRGNDIIDAAASGGFGSFGTGTSEITIHGGAGNDRITALADDPGTEDPQHPSSARNVITGGDGNDIIGATARADNLNANLASNSLQGGRGHDILHASVNASSFDPMTGLNELWGGTGNDRLEASISGFTEQIDATNFLDGGSGDDTLRAFTDLHGTLQIIALNTLLGGDGNDSLTAGIVGRSFAFTPGTASNVLRGGRGNDTLDASMSVGGGSGGFDAVNSLEGGQGNDKLTASLDANSSNLTSAQISALNALTGESGNDTLTAILRLTSQGSLSGISALNGLMGGRGNDTLIATLSLGQEFTNEPPGSPALAENRLDGGSDHDTLVGIVASGSPGASILTGGSGRDRLTVIGGTGNRLNGGDDRDILTGGSGDDLLAGGRDLDTFRFDLTQNQGTDTLLDFDSRREILRFAGLVDTGTPGLVDDLDRLSFIRDEGPDDDVVVRLRGIGTTLIFSEQGTGEVNSWAELVANPAVQLQLEPILI